MSCEHCIDQDGAPCMPSYGVAPHTCFYKIPGATLGQSVLLPRAEWPENFIEDSECPGNGIWYCSNCREGMPGAAIEADTKAGKDATVPAQAGMIRPAPGQEVARERRRFPESGSE